MNHTYDKNLVCACGKSLERHQQLKLFEAKWRERNELGKVDIGEMIEELENLTAPQNQMTPTPKTTEEIVEELLNVMEDGYIENMKKRGLYPTPRPHYAIAFTKVITSALTSERARLAGMVSKMEPPIFLMQDGVSYDWMQKDAWKNCQETIVKILQPNTKE